MKVLTKIQNEISLDPIHARAQYNSNLYPISDDVVNFVQDNLNSGPTTVLFSGGYRLNFDATYIEPKMFSHLDLDYKENSIFISPSQNDILDYTLQKLSPENLLILHSAFFIRYRPWQEIVSDVEKYKKFCGKIIATIPLSRFEFHRLKYTAADIALLMGGVIINDAVVLCQ